MANSKPSGFPSVERVLKKAGALVGAAESHGILCGMNSSGTHLGYESWLSQVLADVDINNPNIGECEDPLASLYQETLAESYSTDLGFQPLLPGDDALLRDRAQSLGKWCEGFLFGLGLGGVTDTSGMTENLREMLRDLSEISKVQFEIEGPIEEAEQDFTEVIEYVRTAVLLVMEELRPIPAPVQIQ